MVTTNFFLKEPSKDKSLVYAIIRFKGIRVKISTGISVTVKYWNKSKYRVREVQDYVESEWVNSQLDKWDKALSSVVERFTLDMTTPTEKQFKDAALKVWHQAGQSTGPSLTEWADNWIDTVDRRKNTIKGYHTAANLLKRFEADKRRRVAFTDVDMAFYHELREWMKKNGGTLDEDGKVVPYRKNYFGSIIKAVKVFMEESKSVHGSNAHRDKKFTVERETATAVYLSEEELVAIHRMVIDEDSIRKLVPGIRAQRMRLKLQSLLDARDRFLIGAFTGLRFVDYGALKTIDIAKDTMEVWTVKTDTKVIIPIHWVVREIATRRGGVMPKEVSNQKLNAQLKWLGQLAELKGDVLVAYTQGGKRVSKRVEKWTEMATHTARRSAATNMYLAGIPTIDIMKITGHKTERAFMGYIGVTEQQTADRLTVHPFFSGSVHAHVPPGDPE